ncbi:hypothetical protein [Streptomyces sp. YS415]|uniref:hypothetical protein n=1 Tax=Streptomyces sp. YS415 TaxID=2944806 RepID=UPI00202107CA|nr:hypothetical protein [Streptomyces sp. YS415]MCL7428973.1 hypothetical protein [Streptomyces sp. YS415]
MELVGLLNTALGALIALGASTLVERRRWLQESRQRARDDRRAVYLGFLEATAAASETLVSIARGHDADDTACARAGTVLRDSSVLSRRLELSLIGDDAIVEEAGRMVVLLRAYRDVVVQGLTFDTEEVQRTRAAVHQQRDRLTRLMRETL